MGASIDVTKTVPTHRRRLLVRCLRVSHNLNSMLVGRLTCILTAVCLFATYNRHLRFQKRNSTSQKKQAVSIWASTMTFFYGLKAQNLTPSLEGSIPFAMVGALIAGWLVFFHPLSHIPGPKLAAATCLPEFYHEVVCSKRYTRHIMQMYE